MKLQKINGDFSVCKVKEIFSIDLSREFLFVGKTDEEISLVCRSEDVPVKVFQREDGWKAFRIQGELDFSLIGILSKITTLLAENQIGIFALSTYNTDYFLVKEQNFARALHILKGAGYEIC